MSRAGSSSHPPGKRRKDSLSDPLVAQFARFAVRVTPRGGRDAVEGWAKDAAGDDQLKVRLRSPAEGGKANAALVDLLAKALDVPRAAVAITSGAKARIKTLRVEGDPKILMRRLQMFGDKS